LAGPIDVWVHVDGTIFVAQFGNQNGSGGDTILLLEPNFPGSVGDNDGDGIPDETDPDDDNDGYTDADEIANETDPLNPAIFPTDFDGDFISDLLDTDDDNDGDLDDVDPFFVDSSNGIGTVPPLFYEYNPGDDFLGNLRNTGFTGVQINENGQGFLPDRINTGAAGGFMAINPTAGDMKGAANSQDNALQIGINASPIAGVGEFTITARVVDPFVSPPAPPMGAESAGVFLGVGADDYIRLVVTGDRGNGTSGIQLSGEIGGVHTENLVPSVALAVGSPQNIDLFLTVDPDDGTVSAGYRVDSDAPANIVVLGSVSTSSFPGLTTLLSEGLGVGVAVTKAGEEASPFVAVYDFFRLLAGPMIPSPASGASALVAVNPGGTVNNSSTFTTGSIQLTNQSSGSERIERVRIDLRGAVLPDVVWDPDGTAGDPVGKPFTPDAGATVTGLSGHALFAEKDGGYSALDVTFDEFDPSETFTFSIDIDPTSIKDADDPGPAGSGSISGLEMGGSTITVFFNNGSVYTNDLFGVPSSLVAGSTIVRAAPPAAPTLAVVGTQLLTFNTATANQTVRVTAPNGATVRLVVLEAGLYLTGVPNGGFDIDPFETNKVLQVVYDQDHIVGSGGFVDVPVTLQKSSGSAGYNHIFAVVKDGAGQTGRVSNRALVELN
ncbi:MAG: hypothetical protein KDD69_03185, partial [Bdellovibrionales bacterium]|nr:hypothetical protein [Bdellovibrionales bacterium]